MLYHAVGRTGVLCHHGDDLRHIDGPVSGVPAIAIGDHRDHGMAKPGVADAAGLRKAGHPEHIAP